MGKDKPRHNPNKIQNKLGNKCTYHEIHSNGFECCESNRFGSIDKCEGNPHNCIKQKYKACQIYIKRKQRWKNNNPNNY